MDYFVLAKKYFQKGYYTIDDLKFFVRAKKITEKEFIEITGSDYQV